MALSLHKYGSNVVEKCLIQQTTKKRDEILDRIVSVPIAHHQYNLIEMINSKYGNYVIQRAFDLSNKERRDILLYKIELVYTSGQISRKNSYARHVLTYLEQTHQVVIKKSKKANQSNEMDDNSLGQISAKSGGGGGQNRNSRVSKNSRTSTASNNTGKDDSMKQRHSNNTSLKSVGSVGRCNNSITSNSKEAC